MKQISHFPKILMACALAFGCLSACHTNKHCTEKIDPACSCITDYDPVCGCNKKTYGNACMAECAGIKTYTKGACPDQDQKKENQQ
jgi:hypothetical protein